MHGTQFAHYCLMNTLITFLYVVSCAMIVIEFALDRYREEKLYSMKDSFQTLYLLVSFSVLFFAVKFVCLKVDPLLMNYYRVEMGSVTSWIVLLVVYDFIYYWIHRLEHTSLVWKLSHIHHHSSRYLNFFTGFRSSYLQPFYMLPFLLPLYAMGFRTPEIFGMIVLNKLYNCFSHQQHTGKLKILDPILNTPSNHRVHHAQNEIYIDKNFAGIFIIWDKLFGTYQSEEEKPVYGVKIDPFKLSFRELLLMGLTPLEKVKGHTGTESNKSEPI